MLAKIMCIYSHYFTNYYDAVTGEMYEIFKLNA